MLKKQFTGNNDHHELLSYEELQDGGIYAFTYNPIDQPKEGPQGYMDWFYSQKQFFEKFQYCKFRLYVEVSKKGRWHFHGLIKIVNRLRFTIKDIKNLMPFGHICVRHIRSMDDFVNWLAYCHKQQLELQEYLTEELFCTLHPRYLKGRNEDGVIAIYGF